MKLIQEELFLVCLEALENGESVEQILNRYPDFVDELRPFLVTAVQLPQLAHQPTLAAQQTSQQRFLQQAAELRKSAKSRSAWHRLRPVLAPLASLVMLLLVSVSLITASNAALPGDALYGTKRLFESFRLTRTGDVEVLQQQTQNERRREVDAVLQSDRNVWVEFEGTIETMQGEMWLVSGIAVQVDSFTRIKGDRQVGAWVRVNGRVHDGILRALSVTVLTADQSPTFTPTVPAAMGTALPTETAVPSPTATTEPVSPTATPLPKDNGDDDNTNNNDDDNSNNDVDDNGNDNSGDDDIVNDNNDDNSNDNSGDDDNINDNDGDDNDNANDNSGDDNVNDNDDGDNTNDNSDDDDDSNDNDGDDNSNNSGDDNANGNDDDDNANDDSGSDNSNDNDDANDNDDNSGSGSNENDNDNDISGSDGSGDNDNDNGGYSSGGDGDNNNDNDDI